MFLLPSFWKNKQLEMQTILKKKCQKNLDFDNEQMEMKKWSGMIEIRLS